jgi:transposase
LPQALQFTLAELISEIGELKDRLSRLDKQLRQLLDNDADGPRLLQVPGVGPIIATAALSRVNDIHVFRRGRAFASWLGITPREHSSGTKRSLGRISRQGDRYLRMLLIHGARAALLAAKRARTREQLLTELQRWALDTEARIGHNKATVALANKMARILWAVWTKNVGFDGNYARRYH